MKNTDNVLSHLRELRRLVRSLPLTECLDWIEPSLGIVGDSAIMLISLVSLAVEGV